MQKVYGMNPSRPSSATTNLHSFSWYRALTFCPRCTRSSSSTHGVKSWTTIIFVGSNSISSCLASSWLLVTFWCCVPPLNQNSESFVMSPLETSSYKRANLYNFRVEILWNVCIHICQTVNTIKLNRRPCLLFKLTFTASVTEKTCWTQKSHCKGCIKCYWSVKESLNRFILLRISSGTVWV